ncbi:DedA family protein [Pseudovibrio sp. JE062]|uniref:DedA family protein n=1 Tax=Pseudovibrio sp. JE062 TaxID=439495 RepID=UPI000186B9E4|nr:VTT domain-containing protein [Pseudovibrio sp. JE062]EEA92038.1 SNARE associated Golgi protein [Pseudovibrio sp. JE062]
MQDLITTFNGPLSYALLAAIAFGDALIGPSFFVFGEIAFLAAGALYAASGNPWPIIVVMVAALLADITSYLLGRVYGTRAILRFLKPLKRRRAWHKARTALQKHAVPFIISARILGPLAWITPFLSGASNIPASRFLPATTGGVLLGVGQFCLYGALGTKGLEALHPYMQPITTFLQTHYKLLLLPATMAPTAYLTFRHTRLLLTDKLLLVTIISGGIFLTANMI